MRIEDLTARQLERLRETKAEVMRAGFLHTGCTDQQFLNAVAVHHRTRELLGMLGDAMGSSTRMQVMNKALKVFAEAAETLWDEDGVWDKEGWRTG